MKVTRKYEILDYLPVTGPMYVPVSNDEEISYSEGYIVRFYKSDGTEWVGNFRLGRTKYNMVFDFPIHDRIIVFAGGIGYIMTPESYKPIDTFGMEIEEVLQLENGSLVCSDGLSILLVDNETGMIWRSERISWDGIKDLELNRFIVSGLSYDPTNSTKVWNEFSLNLKTKEIVGGSYRESMIRNPHIPKVILSGQNQNKPWWKIWG